MPAQLEKIQTRSGRPVRKKIKVIQAGKGPDSARKRELSDEFESYYKVGIDRTC